jgi:hypothetical protein
LILIDGIRWAVIVKTPNFHTGSDQNILGYCDFDQTDIVIKAGMSQDRTEATFFHEILHPMLEKEDGVFDEAREVVVFRLAEKLYATLKGNGLLRDDWFGKIIDVEDTPEERKERRVIIDYEPDAAERTDEPLRGDSDASEVFARGEGNMGRHSPQGSQ